MQTEIEAKWLNIDKEEYRNKLKQLGAELVHAERSMRRKNFDYPDNRLQKQGGWVRVRDEGDKVTMTYKQLSDRSLHGTKEVNLVIDDFESGCQLLTAIGLQSYTYQETKRESWKLGEAQIELDTWPWIPDFIEIEAPTEALVREVATKLELDWNEALHGSVETAYQAVYDVTEEEIDNWREIKFIPVPDWLQKKIRKT